MSESAILFVLLAYFLRVSAHWFPSGKLLSGVHEPLEVHQIFPRASFDRYSDRDNDYVPDRLANLTLLVRSDNERIGDTAPDVTCASSAPRIGPRTHSGGRRPVAAHALQRVLRTARAGAGRDAA